MWQNHGFGDNGSFQNNFSQENFPPSPFGAGSGTPLGRSFFPNQTDMLQYEGGNGEGFISNEFHPEVGLFNQTAFMQNQVMNTNGPFSPQPQNFPHTGNLGAPPRPPTQINARAAELKAKLLKNRDLRASTATPPVIMQEATNQATRVEGPCSLRASPQTPVTATEKSHQELEIAALISQFSVPNPAADASVKQQQIPNGSSIANPQQISKQPDLPAKSQAPLVGSPTKVTKATSHEKKLSNTPAIMGFANRHASNGSASEQSEGEILEDPAPSKSLPTTKPKEAQNVSKILKTDDPPLRKPRDDPVAKPTYNRGVHEDSPPRRSLPPSSNIQVQRSRDERRDDIEPRSDRRLYQSYQPDYKSERKEHPNLERSSVPRRDPRDDEYRRHNSANEQYRAEPTTEQPRETVNMEAREQKRPTLTDLLPMDEDLREWLEITGYHNAPYRNKILNRRRAIAALDAERDKLLAEMEAEERGGVRVPVTNQTPASSMLPPPIPNKSASRVETVAAAENSTDIQRDRVVSNKRPFSDVQDSKEESNTGKFARVESRPPPPRVKEDRRIKEEEDVDNRRPRSSDFDSRRSSIDRRDDRDPIRYRSRERDMSPGPRAYENRPPARSRPERPERPYEDDPYDDDFFGNGSRQYEVRGGYRGKAYDPNYRGRGRGRGRGDTSREYPSHQEQKNDTGFGSRIANGRPFKDPRGFDRGGKGDTRYFIVKSFNEENVLRCIEDSVWTTQLQNGTIFKEAFETCKNVILVFSINKSRAFQGYARMESLPGSVEVPEWQRAINWESAGAFRVKWLVICSTRFHRIGHLKNAFNENQAVLIGKDGQEIEENCGAGLIELINEEANQALGIARRYSDDRPSWKQEFPDDRWKQDY